MIPERDLVVVGGGITGLSLAVHAARRKLGVTLVEAGAIGGVSTQRSGALIRAHYADESSARLAARGLRHFAEFAERYGGDAGFHATGFGYIPEREEIAAGDFDRRLEMMNRIGVKTEVLDGDGLRRLDPALALDDVDRVAYEPLGGYADPARTTAALASAAVEAGARLLAHSPVRRLAQGGDGDVIGVELDTEVITAADTVLCAGAWSAILTGPLGLELPLRATAVKLAFFERAVASHLTLIDAPNGIYLRPLSHRRPWSGVEPGPTNLFLVPGRRCPHSTPGLSKTLGSGCSGAFHRPPPPPRWGVGPGCST